jgi:hypothetical protein
MPFALAFWWFVAKPATLWLLRVTAWFPLAICLAPPDLSPVRIDAASGEWIFNVAVSRAGVSSIEFAAAADHVAFFAVGWFSQLVLAWAAEAGARSFAWKRILVALWLQTLLNVFALVVYVSINGQGGVLEPGSSSARWLLSYAYHIVYLVVPFAGPFAIALACFREWREFLRLPVR